MSTAACHVSLVNPATNTSHRLESHLEASAMLILMASGKVSRIQTQYGPVKLDGNRVHFFDLYVEYLTGSTALFAIKVEKHASKVREDLKLISNQELSKHAHFARVLTEVQISKPEINRATEKLRARALCNEKNNLQVLEIINGMGIRARVFDILKQAPEIGFSDGWTAIWNLIDRGLVIHQHLDAQNVALTELSWVRVAGGNADVH